ncbi:MAG TPA: acyl-CoA reductase, partial [Chryseosolibacter sp.]
MKTEERLAALAKLGDYIDAIDEAEMDELILRVRNENPWFTPGSINLALEGIRRYLDPVKMKKWISAYNVAPRRIKRIAVVMAGNIPLAGFHDFLSVLLSGHAIVVKLSSKDSELLTFLSSKLIEIEPRFGPLIELAPRLKNFDAVIATGSDNSAR